MESFFNAEFFIGNRQRLRKLFTGTAPIVITANGLLQRAGDTTYAFSQDANFWYLTGINEPDIVLVMDRDNEYLIVPSRSDNREAFDGQVLNDALTERSGIEKIYNDKEGWDKINGRLKKVKHVAIIGAAPSYVEQFGMYTNPARAKLTERITSFNSNLSLLDLSPHLIRLRMIKQPQELAALQKAIDITVSTVKDVSKPSKLTSYKYEYQLEAELSRGFRKRGAVGHGFEPIVAGGSRACVLHNVANNSALNQGEIIVIDSGAEVEHYAADITRVYLSGTVTKRQQSVYDAVIEVQKFAFDYLKPGVLLLEYEAAIENYMGEKLRELGLIKTIDHQNVRRYYPHSTSHFLGLNVHDVADYDRPLEPGMVLTVEPGIYISDESIGVRIEDDVLITPKGIKILTNKLSRELV